MQYRRESLARKVNLLRLTYIAYTDVALYYGCLYIAYTKISLERFHSTFESSTKYFMTNVNDSSNNVALLMQKPIFNCFVRQHML